MKVFPQVPDPATFGSVLFRPGQWVDAIAEIRRRHLLGESFVQSTNGSTVVFLSRRHCIKLHPPLPGFVASHRREVAALQCIAGGLPIPTPQLLAQGELEGWTYFVSTRLPGRPVDAVWEEFDPPARESIARQLGEAIRALHELDAGRVAEVTDPWPQFRQRQRARCLDQEHAKGLPARWLDLAERFLQRSDDLDGSAEHQALLHTEIGPSHVLVEGGRITGLIDFGDCMVGDPEYDLAPVGMFVTRGDSAAFRSFALAYGLDFDMLADPRRPARLLRHALLHRYGTLAWYLETLTPPADSLDGLAAHWFGVPPLGCGSPNPIP